MKIQLLQLNRDPNQRSLHSHEILTLKPHDIIVKPLLLRHLVSITAFSNKKPLTESLPTVLSVFIKDI
ncbi:hypothetical protein CKY04_19990 [Photorhabdus sp. S8-52]|nr:hypothetical protein CKY05_20280 [Photorhabdus sp. S10-54]RAW98196.1 hypothetical protein CKY04_19990 [Photorhabdus sp. S8-52]